MQQPAGKPAHFSPGREQLRLRRALIETRIDNGTLGVKLGFEPIWNDTKCVDLANLIPNDLGELQAAVIKSIAAERSDSTLKRSFFEFAGLKI